MSTTPRDVVGPLVVVALALLVVGAATSIGCLNGKEMERSRMQREAIEHGYAEYNPQTGVWQWMDATRR